VLATAKRLIMEAAAPFDNPDLREALVKTQQRDEQIIDIVSQDRLLTSDWDIQAEDKARQAISSFRQFIEQHRDEIAALQIFYNRPRNVRLRYEDVKQLNEAIASPPLALTTDKLWLAYEMLDRPRVKSGKSTKRMLTDIVSLIRYTIERDNNEAAVLEPYSEVVTRRFSVWLKEQERLRGKPFTPEQREWLTMVRDTIASSVTIETDDFEQSPFIQRGGLGKARQLFGTELPTILQDLNERLAA